MVKRITSAATGHQIWRTCSIATLLVCIFSVQASHAWVYPERRDITLLAVQRLDPNRRMIPDRIWSDARQNHESRPTEAVVDATQGEKPSRIDFAAWPAIAGDHSCSAQNMLQNILETNWILRVADVAAGLKTQLANAKSRSDQVNALRCSDFDLLNADTEYATRAGANNVYFLLALPADQRSITALVALANEAYALHFLQEAFAAGHAVGTRGDASLRKGTHDYCNEHGLPAVTWEGEQALPTHSTPANLRPCQAPPPAFLQMLSVKKCSPILPFLASQLGLQSFPRVRAELGPFVGITTGGRAGPASPKAKATHV